MPGSQPGGGECLRERAACAGVGRWSPPCLQPAGNCPVCGSSAEVPRVTRVGRESVPAKEEQRGVSAQAGMGRGSLVTRARPFGVGTSAGGQTGEPGEWVSTDEQMQGKGASRGVWQSCSRKQPRTWLHFVLIHNVIVQAGCLRAAGPQTCCAWGPPVGVPGGTCSVCLKLCTEAFAARVSDPPCWKCRGQGRAAG